MASINTKDTRNTAAVLSADVSAFIVLMQLVLISMMMLPAFIFPYFFYDLSIETLSVFGSFVAFACLIMVKRVNIHRLWSASSIYLVIFVLFHLGIVIFVAMRISVAREMQEYLDQWFYTYYTKQAVVYSVTGVLSVSCGVHIAVLTNLGRPSVSNNSNFVETPFVKIGFLLVLVSICAWFIIVLGAGGFAIIFGSYEMFLVRTAGKPLPYVYSLLGIGMVFLASTTPSALRRAGFAVFLVWCLVALPIGLRGEVMFPAAASLTVFARQNRAPSVRTALPLVICLLFAIAVIKEVRKVGIQGFDMSVVWVNPLDALAEMGGSIRPVSEVVLWHAMGDNFIYGASYWAPFERTLTRIIPIWPATRLDAQDDERIMNILVQRRVGPIGFSVVAEAYRNFGHPGVFLVMFLIGLLLGRMDRWPSSHVNGVMLGVILVPLLIQIRNDFIAVPMQMVVGLLILSLAKYLSRSRYGSEFSSPS